MSVARRSYVDRMSSTDCHTYDARAARAVPPGGPGRTPDSASAQVSSRTRTSQLLLCLRTSVTVLYQDIGDGSGARGGDTSAGIAG